MFSKIGIQLDKILEQLFSAMPNQDRGIPKADIMELQALLNNIKDTKATADSIDVCSNSTQCYSDNELKISQYYNNLSENEKKEFLEKTEKCLQEKLMCFIESNILLENNFGSTNKSLSLAFNTLSNMLANKDFSKEAVNKFINLVKNAVKSGNTNTQMVTDMFNNYKYYSADNYVISFNDTDRNALLKSSQYKQMLNSYYQMILAKANDILHVDSDVLKSSKLRELNKILENMQIKNDNYENLIKTFTNKFIQEAITSDNKISAICETQNKANDYSNLCLEDKIIANAYLQIIENNCNHKISEAA